MAIQRTYLMGIALIVGILLGLGLGYFVLALKPRAEARGLLDVIKERGKLVVGTSADWPPFEYVKGGEYVGIDIEIVKRIAERMGVELEIKDMDFAALIEALKRGDIDVIIADMSITAEREKVVDFTMPYYYGSSVIVALKNSNISSIDDLKGKTVGVQLGTVQEDWAKENLEAKGIANIKSYERVYPEMIWALKSGDIDAIIVGNIMGHALERKDPDLKVVLEIPGTIKFKAIAVPQGAEDLKYEINKIIEDMLMRGEIEEIFRTEMDKWLYG